MSASRFPPAGQQPRPVNGAYHPRNRVDPATEAELIRKSLAELGQLLGEVKADIQKFNSELAIRKGTAS